MSKANIYDVAEYILEKKGDISAMKLQKLVYYSQAWSLVWDDAPIFKNRIEAWANGPVSPDLYGQHRGMYTIAPGTFSKHVTGTLSPQSKETIDIVLESYGEKSAQWLSDQTHAEQPWIDSRKGLSDTSRSNNEINHASMAEYYGSLD